MQSQRAVRSWEGEVSKDISKHIRNGRFADASKQVSKIAKAPGARSREGERRWALGRESRTMGAPNDATRSAVCGTRAWYFSQAQATG